MTSSGITGENKNYIMIHLKRWTEMILKCCEKNFSKVLSQLNIAEFFWINNFLQFQTNLWLLILVLTSCPSLSTISYWFHGILFSRWSSEEAKIWTTALAVCLNKFDRNSVQTTIVMKIRPVNRAFPKKKEINDSLTEIERVVETYLNLNIVTISNGGIWRGCKINQNINFV